MCEFSYFNKILLNLFDILNEFFGYHWNENVSNDENNSYVIMNLKH